MPPKKKGGSAIDPDDPSMNPEAVVDNYKKYCKLAALTPHPKVLAQLGGDGTTELVQPAAVALVAAQAIATPQDGDLRLAGEGRADNRSGNPTLSPPPPSPPTVQRTISVNIDGVSPPPPPHAPYNFNFKERCKLGVAVAEDYLAELLGVERSRIGHMVCADMNVTAMPTVAPTARPSAMPTTAPPTAEAM